jgi:hypothetical protein
VPTTKIRIYIFMFIIFSLILLGAAFLIWDLVGNYGKQQDKIYSGAKFVHSILEHPPKIGLLDG